jgi:hypothetical protein
MVRPLSPVSAIYAFPGWAEDSKGICLPDDVVKALVDALLPAARTIFEKHAELDRKEAVPHLSRHRILIPAPQLAWDQSCRLVVDALEKSVPPLGERARYVVDAKKRWKRVQVEPGDAWGRCLYPEDKTREKAIIDFGSDGTICDAVYIAHEMGHLLAGDMSQEKKLVGDDYYPRKSISELQSFFAQHALYAYLMQDPRTSFLKEEAQLHFIAEITRSVYNCVLSIVAIEAFRQSEKGVKEADIRQQSGDTLEKMLGPGWEFYAPAAKLAASGAEDLLLLKNTLWGIHAHAAGAIIAAGLFERYAAAPQPRKDAIFEALYCSGSRNTAIEILAAAGIVTDAELNAFMSDSVWAATHPLQELYRQGRSGAKSATFAGV